MNLCTQLVENIGGFLDTSAALNEGEMENLASEYLEACNTLNEELKLCAKELHSGNPSEAVRLCEALNVLENYQLLNMENRADWVASIEMIMDVSVPDLLSRLAEELFFCRDEQLSQTNLLNKHRLMAWRKDPLKERLQVLRELYLLNPNNEGWLEDLKQWEAVRCKEILAQEIDQVSTEEDLQKILDEVSPNKMHIALPLALSKKIASFQNDFSQKRIEAQKVHLDIELRNKLESIHSALNNNDINNVAALFQQYNQLYNQMIGINGAIDDDLTVYSQNLYSLYVQKTDDIKNRKLFSSTLNKFNESLTVIDPSKEQIMMGYAELKRIANATKQTIPVQVTIKYKKIINQLTHNEATSKITTVLIGAVVLVVIIGVFVALKFILK